MGSFANTLFTLLLGWLQGIVSAVWSAFTTENGQSLFTWIGRHWITIAGVLCLTGLAADFCVYLFRWKPFRVWKSFFSRKKFQDEEQETKASSTENIAEDMNHSEQRSNPGYHINHQDSGAYADTDLSRWEARHERTKEQKTEGKRDVVVSNTGYIVPEDSPYRRPPQAKSSAESEVAADPEEVQKRNDPVTVKSRRRRKFSVSELFADPEEELLEFDAPRHVIDSRKAYREPVYPRGWNKSEDKSE